MSKSPILSCLGIGPPKNEWHQNQKLCWLVVGQLSRTHNRLSHGCFDENAFSVRNVEVTTNGYWSEICGYAEVPNPSYPAEFLVHFPTPPAGDLWILDTDYENFSSVYACTDFFGVFKIEFAWILVRDPKNVAFEAISRALDAFKKQNLSTDGFLPMAHENCGDYENPAGGKPCIPGN